MQRVETAQVTSGKRRQSSFTLVELLVVIAIIGILVAITLQAASGVMATAARSRAKGEIQAMSTGLESYKTDNGAYPQVNVMNTNGSSSYSSYDGSGTTTNYTYTAQILFEALSSKFNFSDTSLSTNSPATGKAYMPFKSGQLGNLTSTGSTVSSTSTYVADPWGYAYGYNTGTGGGGATTNYPYNGNGFFDLWSTAGLLTSSANNAITNTGAWISNWQ